VSSGGGWQGLVGAGSGGGEVLVAGRVLMGVRDAGGMGSVA
jgi:hypothetical protein